MIEDTEKILAEVREAEDSAMFNTDQSEREVSLSRLVNSVERWEKVVPIGISFMDTTSVFSIVEKNITYFIYLIKPADTNKIKIAVCDGDENVIMEYTLVGFVSMTNYCKDAKSLDSINQRLPIFMGLIAAKVKADAGTSSQQSTTIDE
jgi:hypothetical protein